MTNICQLENRNNTTYEVQAAAMDDRTFKEVVIQHMEMIDECPLMFSEESCQVRRLRSFVEWGSGASIIGWRPLDGGANLLTELLELNPALLSRCSQRCGLSVILSNCLPVFEYSNQ